MHTKGHIGGHFSEGREAKCPSADVNPTTRQLLRNGISASSHLDGLLSEWGRRLPADTAAVLKADLERIYTELC
jgi:hypothetical protein